MDRLPIHEHPTRALAQGQYVATNKPSLPIESEMPDEWGYPASGVPQVSNVPRHVQGIAHQTGSSAPRGAPQPHPPAAPRTTLICRYPNCQHPVAREQRTGELSEYCGLEHMRDAVQRLGFPLCPACEKCPRRTDSKFCGSLCESWAMQNEQLPHRDQQWHQQRQPWQSLTLGSPSVVPSAIVTWSNAARGSMPPKNGSQDSWQAQYQQ